MYLDLYQFIYGITYWLMVNVIGAIVGWIGFHGIANWLGSYGVIIFIETLIVTVVIFGVGMLVSITLIWQERKGLGRLMDMRGTQVGPLGLFQNFADGIKTLLKEIIIPETADEWVYNAAPVIIIGSSAFLIAHPLSQGFCASNSD